MPHTHTQMLRLHPNARTKSPSAVWQLRRRLAEGSKTDKVTQVAPSLSHRRSRMANCTKTKPPSSEIRAQGSSWYPPQQVPPTQRTRSAPHGGPLLLKDALNQATAITKPRLKSERGGRAGAGKAEFLLPAHQASKIRRVLCTFKGRGDSRART